MSVNDRGAPSLNGVRKAAVFTLPLGEDARPKVFRYLQEDEIEQIAGRSRAGAACTRRPANKSSKSSTTCGRRSNT